MPNYRRIIQYTLLVCLVMLVFAAPASAADVLVTIRDRAASLLRGLKPVIFILAGFGLIGFAWMAIFNQISWKWFSNIAIGLFLVANMGLFLDYFTTKTGDGKKYTQMLGSGDYKDNMGDGYQETPGADGDPSKQVPGSVEGPAGPSGSDELDSAFAELKDEKTCTDAGGAWSNGKCSSSSSQSGTDTERNADNAAFEQELAQNKDKDSCSGNGGVWEDNSCKASWAAGEGGTSFTERLDCAESGGNWDGKKCVKNSSTTPPTTTPPAGSDVINPPSGGDVVTPPPGSAESGYEGYSKMGCEKNGGTYNADTGRCVGAKGPAPKVEDDEDDITSKPKDDDVDDNPGATSAYGCQKSGGTWDDSTSTCSKSSNDTPQTPPNSNSGSDVINPPAGEEDLVAQQACLKKLGNKWNPKTNECSAMTKEELGQAKKNNAAKAKSSCEANGGAWDNVKGCIDKAMADKMKAYCASQGMGWTGGDKCSPKSSASGSDVINPPSGGENLAARQACLKKLGNKWNPKTNECSAMTKEELNRARENNAANAKSICESKGGTWSATGVCTDKAMADKMKAYCASQGMDWTGGEKCSPKSSADLKAEEKAKIA